MTKSSPSYFSRLFPPFYLLRCVYGVNPLHQQRNQSVRSKPYFESLLIPSQRSECESTLVKEYGTLFNDNTFCQAQTRVHCPVRGWGTRYIYRRRQTSLDMWKGCKWDSVKKRTTACGILRDDSKEAPSLLAHWIFRIFNCVLAREHFIGARYQEDCWYICSFRSIEPHA